MAKTKGMVYVGIDVSKEKFDVCCVDERGNKKFVVAYTMDHEGFRSFLKELATVSEGKKSVLIGMESTACYHINLFSYLSFRDYAVFIINPLLISNFMKLQLRKTKTDKKDATVIAQFLLKYKETLSQRVMDADIADYRDLARQREALVSQITGVKNDLGRLLTITFPELEKVAGLYSRSMLHLLCEYPSAQAIAQADHDDIATHLIPGSYGKQTDESVRRIMEAARRSIGTATPAREAIVKQKALMLLQLKDHLESLTSTLIELCQSRMQEEIDIMTSIKGIGDTTATNFLVEMGGSIGHFRTCKQLIAMAGIDPSVHQSGKHEGQSRISKRGNRHLRRVIWMMTVRVIQYNDMFRTYYQKRRSDGLPYKKAVLATSHKLMRVIYAMLTNKTTFTYTAN
jgi:transposase